MISLGLRFKSNPTPVHYTSSNNTHSSLIPDTQRNEGCGHQKGAEEYGRPRQSSDTAAVLQNRAMPVR
jgi:hypothetical protein